MRRVTLFSWGYWGWGNATRELVRIIDTVEEARGFGPPVFVDTRYSRSVRAEGFRDHAFEHQMGPQRYSWFKSLGNEAIGTKSTAKVKIHDPAGAEDLLSLATTSATEQRRVIFFCACKFCQIEGELNCHRDEVASLLLNAAERRGESIEVVEWPGGEPAELELTVTAAEVRAIVNGRMTLPIESRLSLETAGALAFGSRLTLRSPADELVALVRPAEFQRDKWVFPIEKWWTLPLDEHDEPVDLTAEAEDLRTCYGYLPRRTP